MTAKTGTKMQYLPLITNAALHLVLALIVLFTATLHSEKAFNQFLLASGFVIIAITSYTTNSAAGTQNRYTLAQALLNLAAVPLLLVSTVYDIFGLVLCGWAAVTAILTIIAFLGIKDTAARQSKILVLTPFMLTLGLLFAGSDQVAIIGWYGVYATIIGVFELIAGLDGASGAALQESKAVAAKIKDDAINTAESVNL